MEVTEQILIECALLKAEDKKRRVQLANNPPILKNIFYFLKNEVNKENGYIKLKNIRKNYRSSG